jgi:peptidoglycan/LPS O-acetylase OafA/YrhL
LVVWVLPLRWLLRLCLALAILSFACRVALTATHVSAIVVYLLTPSQLGGIAIGGAVAIASRSGAGIERWAVWARRVLVVAPFLVVAIGLAAMPGRYSLDPSSPLMDTLGMLILQLLCAAVIVIVLTGTPRFLRPIEIRALRVCGRWSFAMYLMHTPLIAAIYVICRHSGWPLLLGSELPVQLLFTTACIASTVALAALSWRFYEQPIMGLKRLFPLYPKGRPADDAAPVDRVGAAA